MFTCQCALGTCATPLHYARAGADLRSVLGAGLHQSVHYALEEVVGVAEGTGSRVPADRGCQSIATVPLRGTCYLLGGLSAASDAITADRERFRATFQSTFLKGGSTRMQFVEVRAQNHAGREGEHVRRDRGECAASSRPGGEGHEVGLVFCRRAPISSAGLRHPHSPAQGSNSPA